MKTLVIIRTYDCVELLEVVSINVVPKMEPVGLKKLFR